MFKQNKFFLQEFGRFLRSHVGAFIIGVNLVSDACIDTFKRPLSNLLMQGPMLLSYTYCPAFRPCQTFVRFSE